MNLVEKIKQFGKGIALAGALAASGCSFHGAIKGTEHDKNEIYADVKGRAAFDFSAVDYGITRRMDTVTVHSDDGGAAKGGVDLNLDEGEGELIPRLGLEGSVGTNWLRLKTGADVSLRHTKFESKLKRQPLPHPYESYGWGEYETNPLEFNPFLGADVRLGRAYVGFEYGFPHWGAKIKHGDHRYNKKTVREKDEWEGFGRSWRVNLGYEMGESKLIWFVSYGETKYEAEFFGEDTEMGSKNFTFGIIKRW